MDDEKKSTKDHHDGSRGGWSATVFLLFVLAISVGVVWDRQSELNSALNRNQQLNRQVVDLLKEKTDLLKEKTEWLTPCHSDPIVADLRKRVEELVRENEKLSLQRDAKVQTDHHSTVAEKESLDRQVLELTKKIERLEAEASQLGEKVSQLERENEGSSIRYKECSDQLLAVRQDLGEVRKKVEDQLRDNGKLTQELSQCNAQLVIVNGKLAEANNRPHGGCGHKHRHGHHHHHRGHHHHHHGHRCHH